MLGLHVHLRYELNPYRAWDNLLSTLKCKCLCPIQRLNTNASSDAN